MAASLISLLITQARVHLNEVVPAYWTDAELVDHANNGMRDLWRKIAGEYQDYFNVTDATNVTLAATNSTMQGVPANCFRPVMVKPRILGGNNPNAGLIFKPRRVNHPDYVQAEAADTQPPQSTILFYAMQSAGAPVAAPVITVAPQVTAAVNLTLVYVAALTYVRFVDGGYSTYTNMIPGESDNALIAWIVAYARAKETADRTPDPNWLAVYNTEKTNLVAELSIPRSEQDQEVVEAMWQDMWPDWQ